MLLLRTRPIGDIRKLCERWSAVLRRCRCAAVAGTACTRAASREQGIAGEACSRSQWRHECWQTAEEDWPGHGARMRCLTLATQSIRSAVDTGVLLLCCWAAATPPCINSNHLNRAPGWPARGLPRPEVHTTQSITQRSADNTNAVSARGERQFATARNAAKQCQRAPNPLQQPLCACNASLAIKCTPVTGVCASRSNPARDTRRPRTTTQQLLRMRLRPSHLRVCTKRQRPGGRWSCATAKARCTAARTKRHEHSKAAAASVCWRPRKQQSSTFFLHSPARGHLSMQAVGLLVLCGCSKQHIVWTAPCAPQNNLPRLHATL